MRISTTTRNVVLVGTCAILGSTLSLLLQITVRQGNLTRYTINFVYDTIAALLSGVFCLLEQAECGLDSWRLLLANAMCLWLYQWSTLHALKALPLGVVAGLNSSLNPVFAAIFSAFVLAEKPTCWFGVVLFRNIAVIWLMLIPLLGTGEDEPPEPSVVSGVSWTVVLAFSVGASMTLQRTLKEESPFMITFWALAINSLLWLPPGVSSSVRIPFLWPHTENDGKRAHGVAWVWLASAAVLGTLAFVLTVRALHMMELPAFVIIFGPVLIGMNCLYDFVQGTALATLTIIGLAIVVLGVTMDVVLKRQMTVTEETDADIEETKPLHLGVTSASSSYDSGRA
jgi:hypothetical protein